VTRDDLFFGDSSPDAMTDESHVRSAKSDAAFRTISEVAVELDVPQHVLRFWETKFSQIRPMKRGGGRRYYRPDDVTLLKRIRVLLYTDGMTIRGVQKLLREGGGRAAIVTETAPERKKKASSEVAPIAAGLTGILNELIAMRDELRAALR